MRGLKKGFTLIEMILYVASSALILFAFGSFVFTTLNARIKNATILEVEQQGQFVLSTITQYLRNAENITSPTAGNTAVELELDVIDLQSDPTTFGISNNVIQVSEGGATAVSLTSSTVTASALSFVNATRSRSPGSVQISFTLTGNNSSGRNEYEYTKTFSGTASLRQ